MFSSGVCVCIHIHRHAPAWVCVCVCVCDGSAQVRGFSLHSSVCRLQAAFSIMMEFRRRTKLTWRSRHVGWGASTRTIITVRQPAASTQRAGPLCVWARLFYPPLNSLTVSSSCRKLLFLFLFNYHLLSCFFQTVALCQQLCHWNKMFYYFDNLFNTEGVLVLLKTPN